jgi:hypothetical protein
MIVNEEFREFPENRSPEIAGGSIALKIPEGDSL